MIQEKLKISNNPKHIIGGHCVVASFASIFGLTYKKVESLLKASITKFCSNNNGDGINFDLVMCLLDYFSINYAMTPYFYKKYRKQYNGLVCFFSKQKPYRGHLMVWNCNQQRILDQRSKQLIKIDDFKDYWYDKWPGTYKFIWLIGKENA